MDEEEQLKLAKILLDLELCIRDAKDIQTFITELSNRSLARTTNPHDAMQDALNIVRRLTEIQEQLKP